MKPTDKIQVVLRAVNLFCLILAVDKCVYTFIQTPRRNTTKSRPSKTVDLRGRHVGEQGQGDNNGECERRGGRSSAVGVLSAHLFCKHKGILKMCTSLKNYQKLFKSRKFLCL